MKVKLILCGPYRGRTIQLRHYQFTNGCITLDGAPVAVAGAMKYLANGYQAYPEGSDEYHAATIRDLENNLGHATTLSDHADFLEREAKAAVDKALIARASADAAVAAATKENERIEDDGISDVQTSGTGPSGSEVQAEVPEVSEQPTASDAAHVGGGADTDQGSAEASDADRSGSQEGVEILAALELMDPKNRSHWMLNGKPSIHAVGEIAGFKVTRKMLDKVAPKFNRDSHKG